MLHLQMPNLVLTPHPRAWRHTRARARTHTRYRECEMASLPHTVSQEVLDRLMVPSTATLSSALKSVCGIDNAFMHGVAPLKPGCHMAGPAYTLRYIPARADLDERADMPHGGIANSVKEPVEFNLTDPQRVAVESLQAGDVFVIDARGETRCGTMGAILATRMAMRGCVGLV